VDNIRTGHLGNKAYFAAGTPSCSTVSVAENNINNSIFTGGRLQTNVLVDLLIDRRNFCGQLRSDEDKEGVS
jgi:hypothetical protein